MSYRIDCLSDNSPYASNIKRINHLFASLQINLKNEKLRCQITIDLYNLYLDSVKKPKQAIGIFDKGLKKIFEEYLKKVEKNVKKTNTNLKKINKTSTTTKKHYSKLFSSFTNKNIFIEPKKFLMKRLLRNKIDISNFKSKNAIDMGCGIGRYTFVLKKIGFQKVLGIDFSKTNISFAKKITSINKIKNVVFKCEDINNLKQKNEFDFAFSYGSFHHTKSIDKCVKIMKKILKPQSAGFLFLSHKGGMRWAVVQLCRNILRNTHSELIYKYFDQALKDPKKTYLILDHILVPINTLTSPKEVSQIFKKNNIKNFIRLKRGSETDDIERIHKYKKILSKKNLFYIYGYGENRYYFKINEKK